MTGDSFYWIAFVGLSIYSVKCVTTLVHNHLAWAVTLSLKPRVPTRHLLLMLWILLRSKAGVEIYGPLLLVAIAITTASRLGAHKCIKCYRFHLFNSILGRPN